MASGLRTGRFPLKMLPSLQAKAKVSPDPISHPGVINSAADSSLCFEEIYSIHSDIFEQSVNSTRQSSDRHWPQVCHNGPPKSVRNHLQQPIWKGQVTVLCCVSLKALWSWLVFSYRRPNKTSLS